MNLESPEIVIAVSVAISALSAVVCHSAIRFYVIASVLAGLVASLLYQILAYAYAGFLDPFFMIAFVTGFVAATAISFVVGVPFIAMRRRDQKRSQ